MKPDQNGIYEWFEQDGTKRLVEVVDVCKGMFPPYLRVYWWGGYYNVNDEHDALNPQYDELTKAEWPDRWGNRVADNHGLPEDILYLMPTEEQTKTVYVN